MRGERTEHAVRVLFEHGTSTGASDAALLGRFAARGEGAESAFAALVDRHGAMVHRTCCGVLRDGNDADDAFQATFLVLARRAGSLWVQGSLGPWLHRVACRAAMRIRDEAGRRRDVERGAAAVGEAAGSAGRIESDVAGVLHEEVDHLPDRYRTALVLCDLEGKTYEEAAQALGKPVGTVRSRLARGRDRLRERLIRRGLAPAAVAAALADTSRAATTLGLASATAHVAFRFAGADAVAPSAVAMLAERILRSMLAARIGKAAAVFLLVGGLSVAAVARGKRAGQDGPPVQAQVPAPVAPASESKPDFAWRRTDRYEPPDFNAFFPEDREGAATLQRLSKDGSLARLPAAEVLPAVRRGLRGLSVNDQGEVLTSIGGRFVWNGSPQDPDAIEITYHATDPRGPLGRYGGESPSIYYGLMRVEPKSSAILHALVDWSMATENPMDWHWAGWAGKARRDEQVAFLKSYRESPDAAVREKAEVVARYLVEAPDRGEAYAEWMRKRIKAKSGHLLAGVEKVLRNGDSQQRTEALKLIQKEGLGRIMDESFADAFDACAGDPDPRARRMVANSLGGAGIVDGRPWGGRAVETLLRLTRDESPEVRYDAMYMALTPLPQTRRADVVRGLVDLAVRDPRPDLVQRIGWAFQQNHDEAARLLDVELLGKDPARAETTRAVYKELTGRTPPSGPFDAETKRAAVAAYRDLHEHIGKVYPSFAIKGIDWARVGGELLPRAEAVETEEQFGLLVEELVAGMEDSHAAVLEGSATPPVVDLPRWDPGLACLEDDRGRPVVYFVSRPVAAKGVRPGMTVVAIDGVPAEEAVAGFMKRLSRYIGYSSERYLRYDAVRMFHRRDGRGAKIVLELVEDVEGRRAKVELTADVRPGYIPRLPVPIAGIEDGGADVQSVRRKDGIGYLSVRRIRQGLETSLDQAIRALGDVKGLILDVRGNSGGGFDAATAFRNFQPPPEGQPAPASTWATYRGPIAMLIDGRCISAGEGWASWFVANRRARLFGTATAGASARKEEYPMTNGMYKIVIPVKAYTGFLDRPIERRGLEPDVVVRPSAADLAHGRDTVLEAAAAWLLREGE